MNVIKQLVVMVFAASVSFAASASLAKPEAGKEYQVLAQPQQTDAKGKVEVTEFFFYTCPHCNALDPFITAWVKKQGNAISFRRVPVDFGQGQQALQRLYYTLEAMGKLDALNSRIFEAIHKDRQPLMTDQQILSFVTKNGVDGKKYQEDAASFTVATKIRRAKLLQDAYKIEGVPTIYVDGRYMTSPSQVMNANPSMNETQSIQGTLEVLDSLVLKAEKERKAKK